MKINPDIFGKDKLHILLRETYTYKDRLWLILWALFLLLLFVWNGIFLNTPAYVKLYNAFINSFIGGLLVIVLASVFGWLGAMGVVMLENDKYKYLHTAFDVLLNIIRTIPQIIGILIGYILLTWLLLDDIISSHTLQIIWMSLFISLFVFLEITDLLVERIDHFRKTDFYNAMLSCGISEWRIINNEIILKNSLEHVIQKLISIFGITIFLQCSIDFIVSVGLTQDVSLVNFPTTLGNLLASMDSKQDILAVGKALTQPSYFSNLFFKHLQGISTAFIIVFTLFSIYKISNGYLKRHNL